MIHSKVTMDMESTRGSLKLLLVERKRPQRESEWGRGRRIHGASTGLCPAV